MSSVEPVQSNVMLRRPVDVCGPASAAFIATDLTAADVASTACPQFVDTTSLLVNASRAAVALPVAYQAAAAPLLPLPAAGATSLLGYIDVSAQPGVSPPTQSLQNCLTTKLRAARCFALAPSKFTPY